MKNHKTSKKMLLRCIMAGAMLSVGHHLDASPEYDFSRGGLLLGGDGESAVSIGGELLVRHESWDWFGDVGDDYDFQFGRLRLNARAKFGNMEFFVQPQYVSMTGLPTDAVLPPPRGPSGMGALYYLHNRRRSPDSIGFHQAYFQATDIFDSGFDLKLGRFTYSSGLEHMRKKDGKKFNMLKTLRLGDRMISSFEWSAFARSFDGAQIHYSCPDVYDVTAAWMYPTQGGWEKDFNESLEDVSIASLAVTLPKDSLIEGAELGFFAYNYHDDRACSQRVGNCGQMIAPSADIDVSMLGTHLVGLRDAWGGQFDYLAWGGVQWGDWYELDHEAYGIAAEGGYQWTSVPLKPWLRAGYFLGSGDDRPSDDKHGTFFQMAPGTRKYQLFPYYDLQNIETGFLQLFLFPHKDFKIRMDYSINRLAERNDRWYMGTGPTQKEGGIFGYIGRPSMGDASLSQDLSIMLIYEPTPQLAFNLFYSHVWGGDVINNIYPENGDADYLSLEAVIKF